MFRRLQLYHQRPSIDQHVAHIQRSLLPFARLEVDKAESAMLSVIRSTAIFSRHFPMGNGATLHEVTNDVIGGGVVVNIVNKYLVLQELFVARVASRVGSLQSDTITAACQCTSAMILRHFIALSIIGVVSRRSRHNTSISITIIIIILIILAVILKVILSFFRRLRLLFGVSHGLLLPSLII